MRLPLVLPAFLASVLALPLASGSARAQTVPDHSFETPDVGHGGAQHNPTVSGVSFVGIAGVSGNENPYQFPSAPDGDQVGHIASTSSSITFTVSGLMPGSTYAVKFFTAKGSAWPGAPISVAFDGAALGTYTPAATSFAQVTTATFTASGASGSLTFAGPASTSPQATALDNVSILGDSAPNFVPDASFEIPDVGHGGAQHNPSVSGVSFVGISGVSGNANPYQFSSAPDGDQVGHIASTSSSITFTVSGLVPGPSYAVRFFIAKGNAWPGAPISVSFNGAALGTYTPAATSFAQITTATFAAAGTSGSLTFAGPASTSPQVAALDKIELVPGTGTETITYIYDARGRLVNVARTGGVNTGVNTSYTYDKADNRTNVTVTGSANPPPP